MKQIRYQTTRRAGDRRGLIWSVLLAATISPAICQSADPAALLRSGKAALARNDLASAQAAFEQAVRQSPNYQPAHAALGAVLMQKGDAVGAVKELSAARALFERRKTKIFFAGLKKLPVLVIGLREPGRILLRQPMPLPQFAEASR